MTAAERQKRYMARIVAAAKAHAKLQQEITALRQQLAELRRQLAEQAAAKRGGKDGVTNAKLQEENAMLRQENASLRDANAVLREVAVLKRQQPKPPSRQWSESEQVTELQRQLNAARTRIQNLRAIEHALAESLNAARKASPVTITKAQRGKLLKVFHPDTGTHATKKQLDEAAQIFTALKFNVVYK